MAAISLTPGLGRVRAARLADSLAVAVAISLPWSTSATGILLALWLTALVPTLDWSLVRREVLTPAGGLPLALVLLGAAGMLWADVSWAARWDGLVSFLKLATIPLFFAQYCRSERGLDVFAAYLAACVLLLLASFALVLWPGLPHTSPDFGVAVKNAPAQSGEFAICIGGLIYLVHRAVAEGRWIIAGGWIVLMLALLADIVFVATGRTALVMIFVLLAVYAATGLSKRGVMVMSIMAVILASIAWLTSPYLRARVEQIWTDAQIYEQTDARTSSGERIEFAKKSIAFIASAPVLGNGTGSIHALFEKAAAGHTGTQGVASTNPHNQTLAVGIQLGLVGIAVLWEMWLAHLVMFRAPGLVAWIGLLVVVQNVVGSVFNSHLFDFVQGWTYAVGVGVAGGMVLRAQRGKSA